MQSSFVPVEGQAEPVEAKKQHPRRAFLITLLGVFAFFGLLYGLALRMNRVPLPSKLKPYTIPGNRHIEPGGMLVTSFDVDGLPNEEVIQAVNGAFPEKQVARTNSIVSPHLAGTSQPDITISCWSKESCRVVFFRQLSAPEQLYEKAKGFVGL